MNKTKKSISQPTFLSATFSCNSYKMHRSKIPVRTPSFSISSTLKSVEGRPGTPYLPYFDTPAFYFPSVSAPINDKPRPSTARKSKIPVRTSSFLGTPAVISANSSPPIFPDDVSPIMSTIRQTPEGWGYTLFLREKYRARQGQQRICGSTGDISASTPIGNLKLANQITPLFGAPNSGSKNVIKSTPCSPSARVIPRGPLFESSLDSSNFVTCVSDSDFNLDSLTATLVNSSIASGDMMDTNIPTP